MTKLINDNKLDVFTNKLWKRITKSFVSKTLHNSVSGETIFSNGHVEGSILRMFSNKNPNMLIGNGGSCYGVPSTSINAGMNVGKIAMAVDPSLEVGSTVSNVVALAVKKSNNTVKEIIVENETATVYYNNNTNLNAQKIIYININRSFNEEVYFLIGCDRMLWATDTYPITHAFGGSVPTVGTSLQIADYHYSGRFIIFASRTSFEQLVGICNDSVSKTKNNILSGKTILQDAYIHNRDIYSIDNQNATDNSVANSNTKYSGTANKVIPANKNVTSIVVAVRSSMNVGTVATGINVGVVRSDTNEIIEYVHQNSTGIVYENTYSQINASRIVNILINKSWDQDVYFIVGVNGMLWNSPHGSLNLDKVTGGDSLPAVGHRISNLNRTNYIGRIVVLGEVVSLNTLNNKVDISQVGNAANKIPIVGDNGKLPSNILPAEVNGGVRTVNGISPVDGNVTVLSSNIKYVNNQELTVKDAIDGKPNTVNGISPVNGNVTVLSSNIKYVNNQDLTVKDAIDGKINVSDVANNGDKIPRLENGKLVSNILPDTVVRTDKDNVFISYSPKVNRTFTMASFNVEDSGGRTFEVFQNRTGAIKYVCDYAAKFNNKTTVTHLIVPIKNAVVGDVVSATYFVINNDNRVIRTPGGHRSRTVEDIDMLGCKCIRIPVGEAFNERVGFGISVVSRDVNDRNIGMAYAINSRHSLNVWVGSTPNNGTSMSTTNGNYVFPFKVGHETTSELVTRFELEKVANIYPRIIGEYRSLSYDAGDILEENGYTWIKANGQSISKEDYPDLYEKMNTERATKNLSIEGNIDENTEIILPNVENTIGYYYICAK